VLADRPDVLAALSSIDLDGRYYRLCDAHRYSTDPRPKYTTAAVRKLLRSLERVPVAETGGRAFEFSAAVGSRTLAAGLIIQGRSVVEFWWSWESPSGPIGDTMAVSAKSVAEHAGRSVPTPPYPRPEFSTVEELEIILRELFSLAEAACLVVP